MDKIIYCSYNVELVVRVVIGGLWRFFVKFVVVELFVDDIIIIEVIGFNKEFSVGFRFIS